MDDDPHARSRTSRRGPARLITERYLDNVARWYVDRYGGTADSLRRTLMRRVMRSARAYGTDLDEGRALADAIVERFAAAGVVDDAAYARVKGAALRRGGASAQQVTAKLRAKGVDGKTVAAALSAIDADEGNADLRAAVRAAQRRRLGPYRDPEKRAERRYRDLAALARRGFALDIARTVIDAEDADALEDLITGIGS